MTVVLATNRTFDRELLDTALAETDGPVGDVVGVGSTFLLLRHLQSHGAGLIVLGLDVSELVEEDTLAEVRELAPTVPVLLLVDSESQSLVEDLLTPQVAEVLVRERVSGPEVSRAVSVVVVARPSGIRPDDGRRMRHILETITDGVLLTDDGGGIVYANPAAHRILGLDEGTILGLDCRDPRWDVRTLDGDPIPPELRPIPRVLESGEPADSVTYVVGRGEDDDVTVSVSASPMRGNGNDAAGVVASLRDLTREQRVREELGTARRLLDGVVESVPDAMYAKDRDGRYLMINSAGARLFDMTVDEVVGGTDEQLFTPEDAARIRQDDLQVMSLGRPIRFHEQVRIRDGEERFYDVSKAPLRREDGSVAGVVGISRDVTERKRAKRALRRSEEKYE